MSFGNPMCVLCDQLGALCVYCVVNDKICGSVLTRNLFN